MFDGPEFHALVKGVPCAARAPRPDPELLVGVETKVAELVRLHASRATVHAVRMVES